MDCNCTLPGRVSIHLAELKDAIIPLTEKPSILLLLLKLVLKRILMAIFLYSIYVRTIDYRAELVVIDAHSYLKFSFGTANNIPTGKVLGVHCNQFDCVVDFKYGNHTGTCNWDFFMSTYSYDFRFVYKRYIIVLFFFWTVFSTDLLNAFLLHKENMFLSTSYKRTLFTPSAQLTTYFDALSNRATSPLLLCLIPVLHYLVSFFMGAFSVVIALVCGPELHYLMTFIRYWRGEPMAKDSYSALLHVIGMMFRGFFVATVLIGAAVTVMLSDQDLQYVCLLNAPIWSLSVLTSTTVKLYLFVKGFDFFERYRKIMFAVNRQEVEVEIGWWPGLMDYFNYEVELPPREEEGQAVVDSPRRDSQAQASSQASAVLRARARSESFDPDSVDHMEQILALQQYQLLHEAKSQHV